MRGFNHATIVSPSFHGLHEERLAQWPAFCHPKNGPKIPGGVLPEKLCGVCSTLPETLTLFQTKICDFPCPISDLKPVEGLNVINGPKCNKVLITFCPKCNNNLP